MEEKGATVSTLSELIRRGRPLTAASSLVLRPEISSPERYRNSNENRYRKSCFSSCKNPNIQTIKPLNQPTVLVGTLTLPSFADRNPPITCNCFQFSDDSSTVCCEILDFDLKMIGKRIRVLAWNFIPFKCRDSGAKNGFLEIIGWEFFHACSKSVCSFSDFSSFCFTLGSCEFKDNCKAKSLIFGVVESISPVFIVPHAIGGGGQKNISGFLVNVLVCRCNFCSSKLGISELKTLNEENIKDHYFGDTVVLYFSGLASSWHPVFLSFIGDIVLLTGLKNKLVFIAKGESRLMHVTTDEVSLHIVRLFKEWKLNHNADIREKGKRGSYSGVITGVYMQGMVVELDQDVILLLTDQHLMVPHGVRVGAIVTIKNVHFVEPKFSWRKMLILGACYRTSVHMESFSPLETGCHLKALSQSCLQKFINSLSFAARLWALLVVSSFRKKFAGLLSKKEILGSKHMEGLAQKYAAWQLPPSAFQVQHGVLVEFCKHDLCSGVKDGHYGQLRLVLPVADIISYCETFWKKSLEEEKIFSGSVGGVDQKRLVACGGRSYLQSMRRALHSKEIGILLLGTLKVSSASGKLQLVDATGGLDIMLDLPTTWTFDRIFEAKGFTLIMEGIPPKLVALDSSICQPLSCRSIFSNSLPSRRMESSIYLHHSLTNEDSRSCSLFFDWKENYQQLESGKFHLLMLTHKFPVQQKFQRDPAKTPSMFAEAIVLPWDLLVTRKCEDAVTGKLSSPQHWIDSLQNFNVHGKFLSQKRCKIDQGSGESSSLKDPGNGLTVHVNLQTENSCVSSHLPEFPCLISSKYVNVHWLGMLHYTNGHANIHSDCKAPRQKVFLELCPDSFCTFEAFKIGRCYLVKHQEDDVLYPTKENYQISRAKVLISSKTHLQSVTFSSIESLKVSDDSNVLPCYNLHARSNEVLLKECQQDEIPCLTCGGIDNEIHAENEVFVSSSALNFLKNTFPVSDGDRIEPRDSFEEELDNPSHRGSMLNVSTQVSGSSYSDYPLPKGNLITLHGRVMALHEANGDAFPALLRPTPNEGYLPMSLQRNGGMCIHVSVDNETVRIFCDRSKQNFPVGLGRDAYASFHRILVLGEKNTYMMMMNASFITINTTSSTYGLPLGELNCSSGTVGSLIVASQNPVPAALISDALQLSELKPLQFHCRTVGVHVLVLEKALATSVFQSSVRSIPSVGIPFVGFIMDDGSSSCCCWTNSDSAAVLLRLESRESLLTSTASNLNKILEHHGRIVVKNCGSIFDSSCQELAFFVNSDGLISTSDEDLLRSMITNAIVSTSWTISGSIMDPETTCWLEEQLTQLDMAVPPLLNIWAKSVSRANILTQARNIIQELV